MSKRANELARLERRRDRVVGRNCGILPQRGEFRFLFAYLLPLFRFQKLSSRSRGSRSVGELGESFSCGLDRLGDVLPGVSARHKGRLELGGREVDATVK